MSKPTAHPWGPSGRRSVPSMEREITELKETNGRLVRALMAGWSWTQYLFADREGIEPPIPKEPA